MLKARNDIKQNVVNLGATLVEYRATSSMFYNAGIGIRNAWLRYKRKKHSRRKLRPCDVAASELWYSYGVAPLVSDLTASYERLSERLLKPVVVRVTSFDQVRDFGDKTLSITDYRWEWQVSQRAIIYAKLNPDNFTIGNLPELVWERIPFSFVIDWTSNIGDTLSSLDALSGVTSITGVVSTKTKYRHVGRIIPSSTRVPVRDEIYERETHEREVLTTIPLPRLPSWQPSKSWVAIRHAVSLLTVLNERCQKKAPNHNLDILRRN
jgi:hypothetical protein